MHDIVLKLPHVMKNGVPVHNVRDILVKLSRSDAMCALIEWDSDISLDKAQSVVSKGMNYWRYSGYMGTKTEAGQLFLYKKTAYDPELIHIACHGKLASTVMRCLREPKKYEKELDDIGMFCRWAYKVNMREVLVYAVLNGHGSVALSLNGLSSKNVSKVMCYVKLMQYDCYVNSTGTHLIITL